MPDKLPYSFNSKTGDAVFDKLIQEMWQQLVRVINQLDPSTPPFESNVVHTVDSATGGGTEIQVNEDEVEPIADFNDSIPSPPSTVEGFIFNDVNINVRWQCSGKSISAFVPLRPDLLYRGMPVGKLLNTAAAANFNIFGRGSSTSITGDNFVAPVRGYLRNLTVNTVAAQTQGNTSIVRVYRDGALVTGLAVSIYAGLAQGIYTDTFNAILLEKGEGAKIALKVTGAASAAIIGFVTAEFVPLTNTAIFGIARDNATLAAGVGIFCVPGTDLDTASLINEDRVEIKVPFACTIRNLFIRTANAQPGTGDLVFTSRKNQAAGALVATVPAGDGEGVYSDITNSVDYAAGDTMCFSIQNNAAGACAQILGAWFELVATGTVNRTILSGGAGGGGNSTNVTVALSPTYWPPYTDDVTTVNEVNSRWPCPRDGVLRNLYVQMTTFDADNETTFTVYVNGVATTLLISVVGVTAYAWQSDLDPTHDVPVNKGDYVQLIEEVVGGGANTSSRTWSMEFAEE